MPGREKENPALSQRTPSVQNGGHRPGRQAAIRVVDKPACPYNRRSLSPDLVHNPPPSRMHEQLAAPAAAGASATLWPSCLDRLAQELPEQQFNTWIKPLAAQLAPDASRLTLFIANRFKLDWVRAQYTQRIAGILEQLQGHPVQVELALAPRQAPLKQGFQDSSRVLSAPAEPSAAEPAPAAEETRDTSAPRSRLTTRVLLLGP